MDSSDDVWIKDADMRPDMQQTAISIARAVRWRVGGCVRRRRWRRRAGIDWRWIASWGFVLLNIDTDGVPLGFIAVRVAVMSAAFAAWVGLLTLTRLHAVFCWCWGVCCFLMLFSPTTPSFCSLPSVNTPRPSTSGNSTKKPSRGCCRRNSIAAMAVRGTASSGGTWVGVWIGYVASLEWGRGLRIVIGRPC